jgi:hypothetical protein
MSSVDFVYNLQYIPIGPPNLKLYYLYILYYFLLYRSWNAELEI